jgi:glycosyltransferase involved in cell wall biosynthesis
VPDGLSPAQPDDVAGVEQANGQIRLLRLLKELRAVAAQFDEDVLSERMRGSAEPVGHIDTAAVGRCLEDVLALRDVDVGNRHHGDARVVEGGDGVRNHGRVREDRVVVDRDDDRRGGEPCRLVAAHHKPGRLLVPLDPNFGKGGGDGVSSAVLRAIVYDDHLDGRLLGESRLHRLKRIVTPVLGDDDDRRVAVEHAQDYACGSLHLRLVRLGVNAVFLEPRMGGIETFVRRLLPALLEVRPGLSITVFVNEAGRATLSEESWARDIELVTHPLLGRRGVRALSEALLVGSLARRRGCDLLHSVAMTGPVRPSLPSVVAVPDSTWLRVPGSVPPWTRLLWRAVVTPAARRADRVIVYSQAARTAIAEDFGIAAERIDVVTLGPGADPVTPATGERELRERLGLGDGPIVLAVSALLAHKNLPPLVEAMASVRRRVPEAVLVVPANPTPLRAELETQARTLGIGGAVVFPGWVSAADLEGLYAAAACFAFPSYREGFGLPVLEAMRRGVPVACSNASAVPEVAGDAALLFDPHDPEAIADAVTRILDDPMLASDLAARGRARAGLFSWRRTAEETLASYERALAAQ